MIEYVKVTNYLGESITLDMRFPENSGFLIQSIEGIGPFKSNINTTPISGKDGTIFNSVRGEERNIVLTLKHLFKPTVEDVRELSYKYFPIKSLVKFEIKTTNKHVYTYGYVESNEPDIFTNQSGSIISIICPESYLYDINNQLTIFGSVTSLFEFPFSNESLVTPLIEFSSLTIETIKSINYSGAGIVGMVIRIHANGSAEDVEIIDFDTLETISINDIKLQSITGSGISLGDDIYISTVKGDKYAILVRGATIYNILNALNQPIPWFELYPGDNIFAYNATTGLSNLEFYIQNVIAMEGV